MTPAERNMLDALYRCVMAPSTSNHDAVRAAGAALDTETGRKLNTPSVQRSSGNIFRDLGRPDADAKFEAAKEAAARLPPDTIVVEVRADGRHDAEDAIEAGCHAASGGEAEWGAREQRIALTAAREAVHNFRERVMREIPTAAAPIEPLHGPMPPYVR